MTITFKNTKENKVYRDFVENNTDRNRARAFNKMFPSTIADEAVKLHKRLRAYPTAEEYNRDFGRTDNAIEIKKGCKNNEPLILKTRITQSFRLFFHHHLGDTEFLLTKHWCGNFREIEKIYIIEANNHKYDSQR